MNQLQDEEEKKMLWCTKFWTEILQFLWGIFRSAHGFQNTSMNCAVLKLLLQC